MHHKDSASDALQQYGKLQTFLLVGENAGEYSHYHPQRSADCMLHAAKVEDLDGYGLPALAPAAAVAAAGAEHIAVLYGQ